MARKYFNKRLIDDFDLFIKKVKSLLMDCVRDNLGERFIDIIHDMVLANNNNGYLGPVSSLIFLNIVNLWSAIRHHPQRTWLVYLWKMPISPTVQFTS